MTNTSIRTTFLFASVVLGIITAVPVTSSAQSAQEQELPDYLKDRGTGQPTSMFGTYIRKHELLIYPFFEGYVDNDLEYKPSELGYGLELDLRGRYRATEGLIFLGYGLTDWLAVEFEAAVIKASLVTSPDDPTGVPDRIEESGLGDVEGQLRARLVKENTGRPEVFSYFEAVAPNRDKVLIGTPDWELKFGGGFIKGSRFGTFTLRMAGEYSTEESKVDTGEYAIEYLKRLSPKWRMYLGIEGTQDELEFISEAQWHVTDRIFIKLNNGIGLTSKATDWAPEIGIMFSLPSVTARTTLSPRLSASFALGAATRLAAAVRLHSQTPGYEKLFQSDYFLDLTGPQTLEPERALHAVAGMQRQFGRKISTRVDAYYRRFDDLIVGRLETEDEQQARHATYDVPASLLASVPVRAEITTSPINAATGNAYGVEMHVALHGSSTSPLTGWAAYSLGRATRTAYGVTHPFDYDRHHAISIAASLKVGPRLDLAATGRWGTGFPRTPVSGVRLALVADMDDVDGDGNRSERVPQRDAAGNPLFQPDRGDPSNINSARLPDFARLDARLTYRPSWSRERWAFYVDVMNVLNRTNVVLIDTALVRDPSSDRPRILELSEEQGIPFFPSFGIRFWF